MNGNKTLDVITELEQVMYWYQTRDVPHQRNHIIEELRKIEAKYSDEKKATKSKIIKLSKLHDAAILLDSDFKGFHEIGEITLFLEQDQFKPYSLSQVPIDLRHKNIDELITITQSIIAPQNGEKEAFEKYIQRKDQIISYALLKIADSSDTDKYQTLVNILSKESTQPNTYLYRMAKTAEFGSDLVQKEQEIVVLRKICLPSLHVTRFVKQQHNN